MKHEELYSRIVEELLSGQITGWCTPERAVKLAQFVVKTKPDVSTSLGIWGGRDTLSMAMAHRAIGRGKCWAIDPFRAEASVVGQQHPADVQWWSDQSKHEVVLAQFLANVHRLGLTDWIHFQRKTSQEAETPDSIGVLVIDGNHGPDSIKDVEKWAPLVSPKGYVYCDDINWSGGAVRRAVERLKEFGFKHLHDCDTGAFFQRK